MQELFESSNGDFDIQKTHINDLGDYVITAGLSNNGILGKTDIKAKIFNANTITIDMFGNAFYRQFRYKMVTHARVFSLKSILSVTQRQGIFLSSAMHFLKYNFGYENMCSWAKIKQEKISLPVKKDREIDFAFMEDFISQLEACRLSQLEACRLSQFEAYLLVTGLKNYTLTPAEEQTLTDFQNGNIKWGEFELQELFESSNGDFDIQKTHINDLGDYVITAGLSNNGILGKTDIKAKIFNANTITIDMFGNAFYRQFRYKMVTHARVFSLKSILSVTQRQGIFLSSAMHFLKYNFGYENMCSWAKIKQEKISLPVKKDREINFEYMEILISAVQKLVIKDVVEYTDRKIEATREIIHKK